MDINGKRYRCMYLSFIFTSVSHFNLGRHEMKCRHTMRQSLDIEGKHDETLKGTCDRRS